MKTAKSFPHQTKKELKDNKIYLSSNCLDQKVISKYHLKNTIENRAGNSTSLLLFKTLRLQALANQGLSQKEIKRRLQEDAPLLPIKSLDKTGRQAEVRKDYPSESLNLTHGHSQQTFFFLNPQILTSFKRLTFSLAMLALLTTATTSFASTLLALNPSSGQSLTESGKGAVLAGTTTNQNSWASSNYYNSYIQGEVSSGKGLLTKGNIYATEGTVVSKDLKVNRNASVGNNLTVGTSLYINGGLNAVGKIEGGSITTSSAQFGSLTSGPLTAGNASFSSLNTSASTVTNLTASGTLGVAGLSTLAGVSAGAFTGASITDSGTLEVAGLSTLAGVSAGSVTGTSLSSSGALNAGATTVTSLTSSGAVGIAGALSIASLSTGAITGSSLSVTGSGSTIFGGNVGIGTTAPGSKLDIQTTNSTAYMSLRGNGANDRAMISLTGANGLSSGSIIADTGNGFTGATPYSFLIGSAVDKNLEFASNAIVRMSINANGNVGIGTTSPTAALTIGSGQIFVPNGTYGAPSYGFTSDPDTGMYLDSAGSLRFTAGGAVNLVVDTNRVFIGVPLRAERGSAEEPSHSFNLDTNVGMWSSAADILNFSTAGIERLRIDTGGNVGIGTTSPTTALQVGGGGTITPSTDSTGSVGTASLRWNLIRGVTITSGDLKFENDFTFTENGPNEPNGLLLNSPSGQNIWSIDENGNLDIKGDLKVEGSIYSSAWTAVSFGASWMNKGNGYQEVQYKKAGDLVILRGVTDSGSWAGNPTIFTLPQGFRPKSRLIFNQMVDGGVSGRIDILSSGEVQWNSGGNGSGFISLDGIVFSVD